MLKKVAALYFVAISVVFSAGAKVGGDGIVATFNGEAITYYDILSYNRYIEVKLGRRFEGKELQQKIYESRKKATERFVDEKILLKEFNDKGYRLPEFVIEERIDELIKEQSGGDRKAFKKHLRDNELDWDDYKDSLKERVAVQMMLSQFVYNSIEVDSQEVHDYIGKNQESLKKPGRTNLALLMLKKDGKYADKLDETAKKITDLLEQGEDFAKLVEIYSEGPYSSKGGDLGWMDDSNIRQDCRKDISALTVGKCTKFISIEDGDLVLFKLIAKEDAVDIWSDPTIWASAKRALRVEKETEKYEEYLKELRARNVIKFNF